MKIRVKRFDKDLPLPEYKTAGAAAMDCYAREQTIVESKSVAYVPVNVALKLPRGHFVLLVARSSLHKRGLVLANGIGIGDEDFSGETDEYKAALYNLTDTPVQIEKGERLAQMMVLPFDRVEWEEVDSLDTESRGGFGTTGK